MDLFNDQTVYCVGTGPSLDMIDYSLITDSVVIFLNSSFKIMDKFSYSNKFIWFACDRTRILDLIDDVPRKVKKIVTVQEFRTVKIILDRLGEDDIYLQPALGFRKHKDGTGPIHPAVAYFSSCAPIDGFSSRYLRLIPDTVMLNAICLAAAFGAKKIGTLGFDLTEAGKPVTYAYGAEPPTRAGGFSNDRIEHNLSLIYNDCLSRGVDLFNWSPRTHVFSIPNIDSPKNIEK